jgi:hypothetical protein
VDAHVVARADAVDGQVMGDATRALVQLAEAATSVAADEGEPLGDRVGGALEEIGDVELHGWLLVLLG